MPRPLFYLVLATLVVVWLRRFWRPSVGAGSSKSKSTRPAKGRVGQGVPDQLVCGVCGAQYDPHRSGWICPKCGK